MKKTKKWLIWIIIIIAIAGSVFAFFKGKKPVTTYTTAQAMKGRLARTVSATGTLSPDQQIDMSFKTTGTLKSIMVDVGDTISKGQKLATIDTGTLLSQLKVAQAQLLVQQKNLSNMTNHKNDSSIQQRDAQRAMVQQAQASVSVIEDQLKEVDLIAPFDGLVTKRNANPGETVVLNLNSPILTVIQKDDLLIESNIPESDIAKVSIGQNAKVTLDALTDNDIFEARVFKIDPASTVIQGVVYYRIKLKFDNLDPRFKAGMSANVDIATAEKENVVSVPQRAIKLEGDKKFVDVLGAENLTKKVSVETGLEGDDGMVEIVSGLKGGEKVVTFEVTK
ncbi:MAG: efflux RND transporter periplasmic adaptor subunit [Candidatus Moraniibacteriota bacterium]